MTETFTWCHLHIHMQLCKGGGADVGSQVDMHICTDACTHSNQGVGTDEGSMGHAQRTI